MQRFWIGLFWVQWVGMWVFLALVVAYAEDAPPEVGVLLATLFSIFWLAVGAHYYWITHRN